MDTGVQDVLRALQIPTKSNWYALGVGESRVTLFTQQVRALNLAWALAESGTVEKGPVLIIGGGAAGLTVAAGLAHHGIAATVLEKESHLLPLQRNCRKRHLHPHIFDWPEETSENTHADIPLLDWRAGIAGDVALALESGFSELTKLSGNRLHHHCGVEQIHLDAPAVGSATWLVTQSSIRHRMDYAAIVFAVGFGIEDTFWQGSRGSYWADDSLEQHGVVPTGRYLVSGAGDGGLIDTFRLLLPELKQAQLARLVNASVDLESLRPILNQIDQDARLTGAAERVRGELASALTTEGSSLWSSYEGLANVDILDNALLSRLNQKVRVTLLCSGSSPFVLSTRPLHRLLLSRLVFRAGRSLELRLDYRLRDSLIRHDGHRALLDGDPESFSHVIIRHGRPPLAAYGAFPLVRGLLDGIAPDSLGIAPVFPPDFFGDASTVYRGAGGPTQDDYIDELRGNGFLTSTILGDRVPLSRFNAIAMELVAVRSETEDAPPKSAPDAHQEAHTRYRTRLWDRRTGVSIVPGASPNQLHGSVFIQGEAGTGKTTLLKHVTHATVRMLGVEKARFPLVLSTPPQTDAWGDDIGGAIVEAALRSAEISNFSTAARQLRSQLDSGSCIVLLDTTEAWNVSVFRDTITWLSRRAIPFVATARKFPYPPSQLGIPNPSYYELVGLAPTSTTTFLEEHLRGHGDHVQSAALILEKLRKIPNTALWRRTPFLLKEFARVFHDDEPSASFAIIDIYRLRVTPILNRMGSGAQQAVVELARDTLCRSPSRFSFSQDEIPDRWRAEARKSGIFAGSHRLEFVHLTFGEYLASCGQSEAYWRQARGELRRTSDSWHHQLEIMAMAHAADEHLLQTCLNELDEAPDPDHRQLSLVLRAVGYGGKSVDIFCDSHASRLCQLVLDCASLPGGKFDEPQRELFRHASRAVHHLRRAGATAVSSNVRAGEPAAEAWALLTSLGMSQELRPSDSVWWPTVHHQAQALADGATPVERVVALTRGAEDSTEQAAAALVLGGTARVRSFLVEDNERVRMDGFRLDHDSSPRQLGLLADAEPRLRDWAVQLLEGQFSDPELREIRFALFRRDPSFEVRAVALRQLARLQNFSASEMEEFRAALREGLQLRSSIFMSERELLGSLLLALGSDAAAEELLAANLMGGGGGMLGPANLATICKSPRLRQIVEDRVTSRLTEDADELRSVATSTGVHEALRAIIAEFVAKPTRGSPVATAIELLPLNDEMSRANRIACMGTLHESSENWRTWIRAAAVRSFQEDADVVQLLTPFLQPNTDPELATAALEAVGERAQARELVRGIARTKDHRLNNAKFHAIEVLGRIQAEHGFLRELFANESSEREGTRWQMTRDYLRARLLKVLAQEESDEGLVAYLTDPDGPVRDVAIETLLERDSTAPQLLDRAFKETSPKGRLQLWNRFAQNRELRNELEIRARDDLWALRQAFFGTISSDETRLRELRSYFKEAVTQQPGDRILADLVRAMARDPEARPLLRELAKGFSRRLTMTVLVVLREDRDLRELCHSLLKNDQWLGQFWLSGPFLADYFRTDESAKAIVFEMLEKEDHLTHTLIPILEDYLPARSTLISMALAESADINVINAARAATLDDSRVKARLISELREPRGRRAASAAEILKDDPSAWMELAGLQEHDDKGIRQIAYDAAIRLGQVPSVYNGLPDAESEPELRRRLVNSVDAVKWASDSQKRTVLRRIVLNDYDSRVRRLAGARLADSGTDLAYSASFLRYERSFQAACSSQVVQDFVYGTATLSEVDDPKLFAMVFDWLVVKLVSTLPDIGWDSARTYVDEVDRLFGERVHVEHHPSAVVLRLAKDAFELARDRDIWPAANVVFAWLVARRLHCSSGRTIFLVCADVANEEVDAILPQLDAGEVRLGPTVFGFRLGR